MSKPLRVLLIEDSEDDADLLLHELRRGGYDPAWRRVDTAPALVAALGDQEWDVVTCDYVMPQFSALAALQILRESGAGLPVIIVSGQVGEEVAVAAMKAGAHDYVSKHRMTRLVPAIEREVAEAHQRRRAAATLRASEERYRELVESLHDVIFEIGPDERLTYVSPAIAAFGDARPEDFVGRSIRDIVHPDDLPAALESLQRTIAGVREPLVFRVRGPLGRVRWVRTSSRPVFDADGSLRALRGVMTDVTGQVEAEQAYQTVFEHSLQGLAVVQQDRIVLANPALAELTGYTVEELLGGSVTALTAALVHPDDFARMAAAARDYTEGRARARGFEFRIVRRDGRVRRVITAHTDLPYGHEPARLVAYIDVTERWQAEESYRTIFERSVNGLAVVLGDRMRLANPAFAALTGRSLDYLTSTPIDELNEQLVHPDDLEQQRRFVRQYLDGQHDDQPFGFRIVRPDGSVRHVVGSRSPFPFGGESARLVTFVDDTERWQAEQAYRTIFEGAIHGMVLIQGDRIVMANPAVAEITGRSVDVEQTPLHEVVAGLIHPEDIDTLRTHLDRWLALGQVPPRHSFRIRRPDGTEGLLYTQTTIVPHRGTPAALVTVADLTDRWRAEEAYRSVFERSLEGLLVVSGPHVLMANQAAANLTGYAVDELARTPTPDLLTRLVHPDDQATLAAELAAYLSGEGEFHRHELRMRRRDGAERHVLTACAPMAFAGRPAVLFSFLDITDRWRAEAALRELNAELEARVAERTAALQATAQELEAFSYSASHDLRAPLRAIDGLCRAVIEDYADRLPPEAREHLQRMRGATADMATLIDQLLALSNVVSGELRRESVDLSALAREVAAEAMRHAPEGRVAVAIEEGLRAEGDATLLRAVLDNLLANAVKFSRPRPEARIAVGARPDNGRVVFFVRDNGVGFDPEQSDRLFRPFQRLHPASEFSGHGIGLATVLRIVTRHGGRVWAESTPGEGTTFYFTLG